MLVYLAFALAALFYLAHVPVCAALRIRAALDDPGLVRMGLGVFGRASLWQWEKALLPLNKKKKSRFSFRPGKKALKYLLDHAGYLGVRAAVGLGSPFFTALACAGLRAALAPLGRPLLLYPDFSSPLPRVQALCIVRIPLGHIILACLIICKELLAKGVESWRKNPLKA